MSEELYSSKCKACRKKTGHIVTKTNKTKGVKIKCGVCGFPKHRYVNLKRLHIFVGVQTRKRKETNVVYLSGEKCKCGQPARVYSQGVGLCHKCRINISNQSIIKEVIN